MEAGVFSREVEELEDMKMLRYAETTPVEWPAGTQPGSE
jgi:hypothetical protein